jgi:hypothetical protein
MIPLPNLVTMPTITRWGFEALMAITGPGSDVAADVCWQMPDAQRRNLSLEDKERRCDCMGSNIFDAESCNFPQVGGFHTAAVDEEAPNPPPDPPQPPQQPTTPLPVHPDPPVLPPRPPEPDNQANAQEVEQFIEEMRLYEAEVNAVMAEYQAAEERFAFEAQVYQQDIENYLDDVELYLTGELPMYQDVMEGYYEDQAEWVAERSSAIQRAEAVIAAWKNDYGWTFVNKEDPLAFAWKVASAWFAQLFISFVLFAGILFLQKRKDIV